MVLEIKYDEKGNVRNVRKTIVQGMSVTEIRYEYDSQPNPRRNLYELQGINNSDSMYLLSPNNLRRVTYVDEETKFTTTYDAFNLYNENGYPLNGDFLNKMVNVEYQCW